MRLVSYNVRNIAGCKVKLRTSGTTEYSSSDHEIEIVRGLFAFRLWKGGLGMENNSSKKKKQTLLDITVSRKWRLGNCCPYMTTVLNFWPHIALAKREDSKRSQVHTSDHCSYIIDQIYKYHFGSGLSLSHKRRSSYEASSRKHLFKHLKYSKWLFL